MSATDIVIVGAGASGMAAAISAAEGGALRVTLLEKQPRAGRKLLATGNGSCNLTNADLSPGNFHGQTPEFALPALEKYGLRETLAFFGSMGLLTRTGADGRVYPRSMQAASVLDALRFELGRRGVRLLTESPALAARKKGDKFEITTPGGAVRADRLILACGGPAAPKLGGCADGCAIAAAFGHTHTELRPALVQLKSPSPLPRSLGGVRAEARASLLDGGRALAEKTGEVIFTDYGVSGTAVFAVSRGVSFAKRPILSLDLMPDHTESGLRALLEARKKALPHLAAEDFLTGMLNKRLGQALIKLCGGSLSQGAGGLDCARLAAAIKALELEISGTTGFENAQAAAGGLRCDEFDPHTLESRLVPGLFACGELLDIDGECGGYNLQWAWASGRLAGEVGQCRK